MKVLITGARAPVALDLARAFHAAGHDVELGDCRTVWAAHRLSFSPHIHCFPAPARDFTAFAGYMTQLIHREGFDLVVPTCEEVFWLAAAAAQDEWADRLLAPDLPLLRRLHSKYDFQRLLAECGLNALPTRWLTSPPHPADFPDSHTLVFKPEFSRFATHTLIAPSPAALHHVTASPDHPWVAQQRVHGEEICSWSMLHHGRIAAHVTYRPRWRYGQAAAYGMEALNCPAAETVARRVGEVTGMTGQIAFDMILDDAGQVWPIECNPRSISGLHFFDGRADLAQVVAFGTSIPSPPAGGLRHMTPAMALLGIPKAFAEGRLAALWSDWRKGQDVIARGDTGVTLGSLIDSAHFAWVALRKHVSAAAATTDGIEWDGRPIL